MKEQTYDHTIHELDDSSFDAAVAAGIAVVDFWASWCGPCRMMGPVLSDFASEAGDSVTVAKVNVDDSPHLSARFRVQAIPLTVILRDGKEIARLVGLQTKDSLGRAIALAG